MSIFQKTIQPKIDFSTFDLSRNSLISLNFGQIVPCFVQEILPNDHFKVRGASNVQFAPMVAPMMQDVYVSYHYFYCPDRILYKDFETAFTGTRDGMKLSEDEVPELPYFKSEGLYVRKVGESNSHLARISNSFDKTYGINKLLDYLGYPTTLDTTFNGPLLQDFISDLPVRAYFKIWYDWYRDENLQIDSDFVLSGNVQGNGESKLYKLWDYWYSNSSSYVPLVLLGNRYFIKDNEPTLILDVKYRSYKKDYFTACLPSPQKGDPVQLSLSGSLPVSGNANILFGNPDGIGIGVEGGVVSNMNLIAAPGESGVGQGVLKAYETVDPEGAFVHSLSGTLNLNADAGLTADLSQAAAVTINELRTAFALQRILEAMSVSGSRYNEFLLSQYGTAPKDLRLMRPQFLGGWTQKVAVQQVIQTGGDLSNNQFMNQPGYSAGRMFSAGSDFIFSQTFREPGYIIGLMSVMPKAGYFQGMPKHLTRANRFDYYNPHFAYLGEQAVKNKELYFTNNESDDQIFGYMQRWAEYRTSYDSIHGDFKGSLKHFHMYREFDSVPTLSEDFILARDVDTRPFVLWKNQTDVNGRLIWANVYHDVKASRPLPYNPMPGIHA